MRRAAALAPLLLAACTLSQPAPVLEQGAPACPPQLMAHANHVMAQMPRVRLGADKAATQSLLGNPLRAESFLLNNGSMVEVLSYPTPEGACPTPGQMGELMPLVFSNNRLQGYGSNYYRDFIVPSLKAPLSMQNTPEATQQLKPSAGSAYPGRLMQEDLPNTAVPDIIVADPDEQGADILLPAEYAVDPRYRPQNQPQLGRGTPLR